MELGEHPQFHMASRPDLLGGVRIVTGVDAEGKRILAIPFYAMANREPSAQEVWVVQRGLKPSDAFVVYDLEKQTPPFPRAGRG